MKNNLLALAIATTVFTSCGEDGTADIVINDNSVTTTNNTNGGGSSTTGQEIELNGNYASDLSLDIANTYIVTGPVIIEDGATLTIPAGMTIKAAATGADVYVAISQGAKIDAQGTANQPIIFTSAANTPNAGDWGGLILLGKAPINSVSGSGTSTSEIASLPFGGNDASDDSGKLRYVRVEYSGGKADGNSENNGFSFYGVGNSTLVEYIQMYEGKDDGVEFYGGTVNVSYISIVNAQDDSIDWTEGYTGTITDAYVKHGTDHDKGIEADGYNTDIGNNSSPLFWSKPTVNNLTIVGLGSGTGNEAIRLRAGTQAIFSNVLLKGFAEGFDLDGDAGATSANPTGTGVINGDLDVSSVSFEDITVKMKNDTGETFTDADFYTEDANATGTDYTVWGAGWTRQ
ncbi:MULTISPECIES: multidrug transporter [Tenacibaculum]|uniref:multidrug transporter n=1 Tax=Tenacibaculum TaxID=104267 RepID=UPI001F0A9CC3|nr:MULTISPECIES: multidrug transporter [Tenacibaculum]MCH3881063.1 multidrug transporter [Tenacibaculum aquimarinum]MCH3884070.1 multidrug transporter [Tenacibaculum aquimarinum]MDO6599337.1 multidrug transporter [Tenacibaculum sp. 1_MG-2023]